jgi:hypothetical protein
VTRLVAIVAGVLVLAGGVVALVFAFSSRDDASVGSDQGIGHVDADHGARHLPPGEHADVPAGRLPTSGPHHPILIQRDARPLDDDAIIHALELGDVVILYETARPPAALVRLQRELTGPFDAELAAAGQAVVLARRPGSGPATALAWDRDLRASSASDPRLRDFAETWLGRGLRG